MHLLVQWVASAIALYLTVILGRALGVHLAFTGQTPILTAFIAALVFGLVNAIIRPIVKLFALPITCATLGLFTFVINALMFWLTAAFVHGFVVKDFGAALFGTIVMSIVGAPINWALSSIFEPDKPAEDDDQ